MNSFRNPLYPHRQGLEIGYVVSKVAITIVIHTFLLLTQLLTLFFVICNSERKIKCLAWEVPTREKKRDLRLDYPVSVEECG